MASRARLSWLLFAACGCGRIDFDAHAALDAHADAASPVGPCGTATLFADDFEDGSIGADWLPYVDPGTAVNEASGRIVFSVAAGSGQRLVQLASLHGYDLRESAFSIEVPQPPTAASAAYGFLQAQGIDGNLAVMLRGGTLTVEDQRMSVGLPFPILASRSFDPVLQRYWRIRGEGGEAIVDTSPDGANWTEISRSPAAPLFAAAHLNIGALTSASSAVQIIYDNANGGGPTTGAWCPASSTSDEFSVMTSMWKKWGSCTPVIDNGALAITVPAGAVASCGWYSRPAFDLSGAGFSVEVPQILDTASDAWAQLEVKTATASWTIRSYRGTLELAGPGLPAPAPTLPYDPVAHRFWRIAEQGGDLSWETSADGSTWTTRATASGVESVTAVTVSLNAGIDAAAGVSPGTARFDNLNRFP